MSKALTPQQLAQSGSEDAHQMALFAQAALHYSQYPQLKWMHAIPNGGSRHLHEAVKLKATGLRSGVWDIFLPTLGCNLSLDRVYHGLYIEMKKPDKVKAKNGGLTDEQIEFMTYAVVAGYKCVVAYSWEQAWDAIVKYLNGE